jgi:hypothetical protein
MPTFCNSGYPFHMKIRSALLVFVLSLLPTADTFVFLRSIGPGSKRVSANKNKHVSNRDFVDWSMSTRCLSALLSASKIKFEYANPFVSLLKLSAIACAFLLSTLPSFGFCPQPEPTVACEFLNSDAVFVGNGKFGASCTAARCWRARRLVVRADRSGIVPRIPNENNRGFHRQNSSGRFTLEARKTYFLFADKIDGRLTITNCDNSALQSKAQEAIRELHGLLIPEDGVSKAASLSRAYRTRDAHTQRKNHRPHRWEDIQRDKRPGRLVPPCLQENIRRRSSRSPIGT